MIGRTLTHPPSYSSKTSSQPNFIQVVLPTSTSKTPFPNTSPVDTKHLARVPKTNGLGHADILIEDPTNHAHAALQPFPKSFRRGEIPPGSDSLFTKCKPTVYPSLTPCTDSGPAPLANPFTSKTYHLDNAISDGHHINRELDNRVTDISDTSQRYTSHHTSASVGEQLSTPLTVVTDLEPVNLTAHGTWSRNNTSLQVGKSTTTVTGPIITNHHHTIRHHIDQLNDDQPTTLVMVIPDEFPILDHHEPVDRHDQAVLQHQSTDSDSTNAKPLCMSPKPYQHCYAIPTGPEPSGTDNNLNKGDPGDSYVRFKSEDSSDMLISTDEETKGGRNEKGERVWETKVGVTGPGIQVQPADQGHPTTNHVSRVSSVSSCATPFQPPIFDDLIPVFTNPYPFTIRVTPPRFPNSTISLSSNATIICAKSFTIQVVTPNISNPRAAMVHDDRALAYPPGNRNSQEMISLRSGSLSDNSNPIPPSITSDTTNTTSKRRQEPLTPIYFSNYPFCTPDIATYRMLGDPRRTKTPLRLVRSKKKSMMALTTPSPTVVTPTKYGDDVIELTARRFISTSTASLYYHDLLFTKPST